MNLVWFIANLACSGWCFADYISGHQTFNFVLGMINLGIAAWCLVEEAKT